MYVLSIELKTQDFTNALKILDIAIKSINIKFKINSKYIFAWSILMLFSLSFDNIICHKIILFQARDTCDMKYSYSTIIFGRKETDFVSSILYYFKEYIHISPF